MRAPPRACRSTAAGIASPASDWRPIAGAALPSTTHPLDHAVLLVNRAARGAARRGWLDGVRDSLASRFVLDVQFPRDAAWMASAARDASAAAQVVIVAGGDGTVSIVADALSANGGTLGIIPLGTANDLARELGLPLDPAAAAAVIARGTVHRTDLVGMNGRCFITVGGLGLVSRSTVDAAHMRAGRTAALARSMGAAIYRVAATRALFGRRITGTVWIQWRHAETGKKQRRALDVHAIFITNHAGCGGGLVIPSGARADDGLFELALVPRTSRIRLLIAFTRLSAGLPLAPDTLIVLRTDHAIIETAHDDRFVADGEMFEGGRRFELSARPGAIGILR